MASCSALSIMFKKNTYLIDSRQLIVYNYSAVTSALQPDLNLQMAI